MPRDKIYNEFIFIEHITADFIYAALKPLIKEHLAREHNYGS